MRESLTDQLGKLLLVHIVSTKAPSASESFIDCRTYGSIVVSVDTGSIFAEKVGVDVTVKGGEGASIARGESYGEWIGMEDSPSVTTWLVLAR